MTKEEMAKVKREAEEAWFSKNPIVGCSPDCGEGVEYWWFIRRELEEMVGRVAVLEARLKEVEGDREVV